jgi:hypothetical protein
MSWRLRLSAKPTAFQEIQAALFAAGVRVQATA